MKNDIETKITAWTLIMGALMLLLGWVLIPHHIAEYFVASDFSAVNENFWFWVWMYRLHIFGWVIMGAGLMGFTVLTFNKPHRILLVPGAGVLIIGTFISAIAAAYYYSYGAWGIGQTLDKNPEEILAFMDNVIFTNHYVSCILRFGRVFSGAGLVIIGAGLLTWKIMDTWFGLFTVVFGISAMAIIMLVPDNFEMYKPMFYVKVVWVMCMGILILRKGLPVPD